MRDRCRHRGCPDCARSVLNTPKLESIVLVAIACFCIGRRNARRRESFAGIYYVFFFSGIPALVYQIHHGNARCSPAQKRAAAGVVRLVQDAMRFQEMLDLTHRFGVSQDLAHPTIEMADSLRTRFRGARIITDDNMGTEWSH